MFSKIRASIVSVAMKIFGEPQSDFQLRGPIGGKVVGWFFIVSGVFSIVIGIANLKRPVDGLGFIGVGLAMAGAGHFWKRWIVKHTPKAVRLSAEGLELQRGDTSVKVPWRDVKMTPPIPGQYGMVQLELANRRGARIMAMQEGEAVVRELARSITIFQERATQPIA